MQHHPPFATTTTEQLEKDADAGPLAWLGGGLSLALWACATMLALQFL